MRCRSNDVAEILPNLASDQHLALKRMAASEHSALKLMAASSQGASSRGMSAWETDAAVCRQRTVAETPPSELVVRPTLLVAR